MRGVPGVSSFCMAQGVSFPGIGSGINGAQVSKVLFDQLTLPNIVRQNEISSRESENNALSQLKTLLLNIADTLDAARTSNGGISGSKIAASNNEEVLTAAADSTASAGSVSVNVLSLAKGASGSFGRSFANKNNFIVNNPSQTGSVSFTVGTGDEAKTFSVEVDELTTVQDFVNEFNEKADGSAAAQLVNIGTESSPSYRVVFNTSSAGTEEGSLNVSSDNPALLADEVLGASTVEQASNATFTVSGIAGTIERSSNNVSDVIQGVTLQLSGTGSAVLNIQDDAGAASSRLEDFVSAFNQLVQFINDEDKISQQKEDGETVNVYGALVRTNVDDQALSAIRGAISSARSGDGATSLASLGIATQRDGTLSFDQEQFEAAFSQDPEGVTETVSSLADKVSGIQGAVQQFTGFNLQIDQAISANDSVIEDLNNTISKVEGYASDRARSVELQFSKLDALFAKFNAASGYLSTLLNF